MLQLIKFLTVIEILLRTTCSFFCGKSKEENQKINEEIKNEKPCPKD